MCQSDHVQVDLPLVCNCFTPKKRMEQHLFKSHAETGFFQVHAIGIIIRGDSTSCPENVEPGLVGHSQLLKQSEVMAVVDLWLVWEDGDYLLDYLERSLNISHHCSQQLKHLPLKNHTHLYGQYVMNAIYYEPNN